MTDSGLYPRQPNLAKACAIQNMPRSISTLEKMYYFILVIDLTSFQILSITKVYRVNVEMSSSHPSYNLH